MRSPRKSPHKCADGLSWRSRTISSGGKMVGGPSGSSGRIRSSNTCPAVRAISRDRVDHRRQRRVGDQRHRPIVVADQRDIPRHGPAGRPEHAPAHPPPSGRSRRRWRPDRGAARAARRVAAAPPGVVKSPCSTASAGSPRAVNAAAQPASRSTAAIMSGGSGNGADPAAAAVDQMTGRQLRTQPVVGVDIAELVRQVPGPADEHAGHRADSRPARCRPTGGGTPRPRRRRARAAGSGWSGRRPRRCGPSAAPTGTRCAPRPARALDDLAEERVPGHPVVRFGDDQRNGVRPMGDQGPGRPVRGEAQALHRGVDRGLRVRADPAAAVDRPGRGRPGNAGRGRDVFQGR